MSIEEWRAAVDLTSYGDLARRAGNVQEARRLYAEAAAKEMAVFAATPVDREQTRGILARSAAWLLREARQHERLAFAAECWMRADLPGWAKADIACASQWSRERCAKLAARAHAARVARRMRRRHQRRG